MKKALLCVLLAGCAADIGATASAQTLDPLFQSPDQDTAPPFPAAAPNNGAPIASIGQITGFGRTFAFGSSSTDTRSSTSVLPGYGIIFSNGNANYAEILAPIIGATDRPGQTAPLASPTPTNFGIAGTDSLTALAEVGQFKAAYGRFAQNDIAILWSGINDWDAGGVTAGTFQQIAANDTTNLTTNVQQLINLGAHNLVVIGQAPFGTFQFFEGLLGGGPSDLNAINQGAQLVDQGLLSNLTALHGQSGANIHYFDLTGFIGEIRANPTSYGFSVAGVQPLTNCFSLLGITVASCPANASFAQQNQFLSWDGIHWTYRFHAELAQAIANQLIAPFTIAPQSAIAASTSQQFSTDLLLHVDALREQSQAVGSVSVFTNGGYSSSSQSSRAGAAGFDSGYGTFMAGASYRAAPNLVVGGAFDYDSPSVDLSSLGFVGATQIGMDAYQFAGFVSVGDENWFADLVVQYGFDQYNTARTGLIDSLRSSHSGGTFGTTIEGAYLFNFGGTRLGPIGHIGYTNTEIDGYTEQGDPLLTQIVGRQNVDRLSGGAGAELLHSFVLGSSAVRVRLDLTAERDFIGGDQTLHTAQIVAPALGTATPLSGYGGGTYGAVTPGVSVDLTDRMGVVIGGRETFGRLGGDEYSVEGSLHYRF